MPTRNTRMSEMQDKKKETVEQARGYMQEAVHETEEMVRRNPGTSALVTFGIGFGIGLLATHLLTTPHRRRTAWYDRYRGYLPDVPSRNELVDALGRLIPDALGRR